jgi:Flp pilus assembly protein TadB
MGMADRIPLVDVRILATAILIQREVGGNLAEILDNLAEVIRQRFNIKRQLNVYTAQGRLSGLILSLLPIGVGWIVLHRSRLHAAASSSIPAGSDGRGAVILPGLWAICGSARSSPSRFEVILMIYLVAVLIACSIGLLTLAVAQLIPARSAAVDQRLVELQQISCGKLGAAGRSRGTPSGSQWRKLIHDLGEKVGESGSLRRSTSAGADETPEEGAAEGAPDALDSMVVCVEAGLGLNQAIVRVSDEIRHISELMSQELALVNFEIRAGTPREDALRNLGERTGLEDIRSLVAMLIQTDRFGTSVAQALRVQSDTLRTKRRQRAEEAAAKTAIKMLFPLVFFILPALFVVVLGPGMIQLWDRCAPGDACR